MSPLDGLLTARISRARLALGKGSWPPKDEKSRHKKQKNCRNVGQVGVIWELLSREECGKHAV